MARSADNNINNGQRREKRHQHQRAHRQRGINGAPAKISRMVKNGVAQRGSIGVDMTT